MREQSTFGLERFAIEVFECDFEMCPPNAYPLVNALPQYLHTYFGIFMSPPLSEILGEIFFYIQCICSLMIFKYS